MGVPWMWSLPEHGPPLWAQGWELRVGTCLTAQWAGGTALTMKREVLSRGWGAQQPCGPCKPAQPSLPDYDGTGWDTLCFLDFIDYFLSHFEKFSTVISSKIFSLPFIFSSFSETPITGMLVYLILSQSSLRYNQFFSFFSLYSALHSYLYHFIF